VAGLSTIIPQAGLDILKDPYAHLEFY